MPSKAHPQERCPAPHEVDADHLDEPSVEDGETGWEDLNGCEEWELEP